MCVLTTIKTHEFFDKFFEDTQLHPEMRKNLEIIEHQVKYNLPVAKEVKSINKYYIINIISCYL